ncbi:recombinase family protein [Aneurinibacillus migulanus]|uniref:Integrase n=1 Tax=Aneurinibacillus migulanus TaxID=47500 RepID=A0A0D1XKV8_ANEMI|nr:recombinase family protein [Aneurinibacillus migulanus]KIV52903.1 integrase [Aneurinibacillus migulanus]KON95180.1 integrase [Aneurinibacillus migulanus]MED0890916.1 recombinase family protein [Aneurinibacillus migulanus]MED1616608.1 recombinase family protein [Aneurinibacillus migulanus]SDI82509.1 site-specific DNA recombinase [Aneurinibacillus migulanus]
MYTAIYIRVSTGMQATEGTGLEGQYEACLKKAQEFLVSASAIKLYKEDGFTGEDISRPAMNELRSDVSAGRIERVIITHPDRLTRDLTDKLILCREFEKSNVELVFVDTEYRNTPEGQLFFNLMSSIAQYELSLIKKRTVRGRLKAVEKDKKIMPMRVAPYGFNMVNNKLLVNEEEAEFVKKVYHWYVYEGLTLREIGERLFTLGAEPKRAESRNWGASSIRRILTSEIYIGKYYYNRRQTSKVKGEKTKSGSPRKTYSFRDKSEWIMLDVPPIIDEQLFELAQRQREVNTKKSGNVKYEYLLKSLIRCGHCGRMWQSTTYSGRVDKQTGKRMKYMCYRCPNLFPKKYGEGVEKCCTKSLRAEELDRYIWGLILETISNPDDYIQRITRQSGDILENLLSTASLLQKQVEQKEKEKEKIKTMFKREVIDEKEMVDEMQKINTAMRTIQAELEKYEEQVVLHKEKEMSADRIKEIAQLINQFVDNEGRDLTFDEKRTIVEALVDEIIIRFNDNSVEVTAVGALDELKRQRLLQHCHDVGSGLYHQEI